jgi:hypothetical protein
MANDERAGLPLPGKKATTGGLLLPRLIVVGVALVLMTSCAGHQQTRSKSIRIAWAVADKERFAYLITPSRNDFSEIAIVFDGEILERSFVECAFPELLKLTKPLTRKLLDGKT